MRNRSTLYQSYASRTCPASCQSRSSSDLKRKLLFLLSPPASCQVYGPNIISKQMCFAGVGSFPKVVSVHDEEEHNGLSQLINDDLVQLVRQRVIREPSLRDYGAEHLFSADIAIIALDCH
ncbi:hypothetical protein TNCV_3923221 [Trichonephila clavipes]|nr:hypothetical protein TNCV_3923221 [Trichonephila clavipes]